MSDLKWALDELDKAKAKAVKAERTIEGFKSHIGELLGDSIKNHRQESEFLEYVADEVGKRDAAIEGLREEIKGYREWQHKQEHLRSVIQEQRDTLKSQLAGVGDWVNYRWGNLFPTLRRNELKDILSPSHTCPGCEGYKKRLGEKCRWTKETQDNGLASRSWWNTSCGRSGDPVTILSGGHPTFADESPTAEGHKYCPYCGRELDTALNGGDSFLSGNPHHLSTDTALNGKEGEDG